MRFSIAAAVAAITLALPPLSAGAGMSAVSVPVTLDVVQACGVSVPDRIAFSTSGSASGSGSVPIGPDGKPQLSLESVLLACSAAAVPAALTVTSDSNVEGSYVATVNF
jgi:hypothetical protein